MDEAALNGDHGPEAQANAVLAEVDEMIQSALSEQRLQAGNAETRVVHGQPIIVGRANP